MKEKTLVRISVLFSILGIIALLVISKTVSLEETKISEIDGMEEKIKVRGVVTEIRETEKTLVIEITQPETIKAIYFKDGTGIGLEKGEIIEVVGSLEEYNGETEIIVEEVGS